MVNRVAIYKSWPRIPLIATLVFVLACAAGGTATADSQTGHSYHCAYAQQSTDSIRITYTITVTPTRLGRAWCSQFQHHFHPALPHSSSSAGRGHRFCVLTRRASGAHAVLDVYADESFAGIATCRAFRTFPPAGFRRR